MGRWLYIFQSLAETPIHNAVKGIADPDLRVLLHTKKIAPLADLRVIHSMPFIPSFCDIKLGESMFRDAQSHFNYNVSSQQLRRMLRLDLSILEELFP